MSMTVLRNRRASGFRRWNELRPMIEPKPPPSRIALTCSKTASSVSAAPPEKITIRRPSKAAWTTAHAFGERPEGYPLVLVDLLRRGLFDVRRGQLHLDDVGAELGGDVGGVRRDVDRRLAFLGEPRAARVRPHHHGEPVRLRLLEIGR